MKRVMIFAVVVALGVTILSGCSRTNDKSPSSGLSSSAATDAYPLDTDVELTLWAPLSTNVSATSASMGDTRIEAAVYEATGVKINYIHPTQGEETVKFNLMIAADNLPDMITYNWFNNFPGGPAKAIEDGYILSLNELFKDYAPNFMKLMAENKDVDKMVKTDNGDYYAFPLIKLADILHSTMGTIVRADWLDDLNLEVPETIDDWTTVLTAFKKEKSATAPLSFNFTNNASKNILAGAFHSSTSFFIDDDGEVQFGPIEPSYKEYLTLMNDWFDKGLLDKNISAVDGRILDTNMLTGKTGITFAYAGSGLGKWVEAMAEEDDKYALVGALAPVIKRGTRPWYGQKDFKYGSGSATVVTTSCKHPEIAVRYLDYAYGEEGHMLNAFGIEGESYNMVNGQPVYTDLILNNPDGLSINSALALYTHAGGGPAVQDPRYLEQFYTMPEQLEAVKLWSDSDAALHNIPFIEESPDKVSENTQIMNSITTYVEEMSLKFIMGLEPLAKFDDYVNQCKQYGIETVLQSKREALVRYNNR